MPKVVLDKKLFEDIVSGRARVLKDKKLRYGRYRIVRVLEAKGGFSGR